VARVRAALTAAPPAPAGSGSVGRLLGEHQVPGSIALTYRAHAFVRLTAEALVANLSALNTTAAASVSVRA